METFYTINYSLRRKKRQRKEKIMFYTIGIVIAVALAFLVIRFCAFGITMRGDSMKSTIDDGQFCVASRLSYLIGSPKQDDMIVFQNGDDSSSYYIKRVIAVPGDEVQITNGKILVNGKEVEQKGSEKILSGGLASQTIKIGKDQYFVLGDNYNNSEDSRVASVGNVNRKNILGKIKLRLW